MNFRKAQDTLHESLETQRLSMIQGQLKPNGITNQALIEAFSRIDRRLFVPTHTDNPYVDQMIKINNKRMILSPLTLGLSIQALNITENSKTLVIGCNFGYSLAILSQLTQHTYGIEKDVTLFSNCRKNLNTLEEHVGNSMNDATIQGNAPYDAIIIEGVIERLPKHIIDLLSTSGAIATLTRVEARNTMSALTILSKTPQGIETRIIMDTPGVVMPGFERDIGFEF